MYDNKIKMYKNSNKIKNKILIIIIVIMFVTSMNAKATAKRPEVLKIRATTTAITTPNTIQSKKKPNKKKTNRNVVKNKNKIIFVYNGKFKHIVLHTNSYKCKNRRKKIYKYIAM